MTGHAHQPLLCSLQTGARATLSAVRGKAFLRNRFRAATKFASILLSTPLPIVFFAPFALFDLSETLPRRLGCTAEPGDWSKDDPALSEEFSDSPYLFISSYLETAKFPKLAYSCDSAVVEHFSIGANRFHSDCSEIFEFLGSDRRPRTGVPLRRRCRPASLIRTERITTPH
jgi:hypothetical protein